MKPAKVMTELSFQGAPDVRVVIFRGYPVMAITYRTDPEAPASDDSLVLAGQDEHADVAAAVDPKWRRAVVPISVRPTPRWMPFGPS